MQSITQKSPLKALKAIWQTALESSWKPVKMIFSFASLSGKSQPEWDFHCALSSSLSSLVFTVFSSSLSSLLVNAFVSDPCLLCFRIVISLRFLAFTHRFVAYVSLVRPFCNNTHASPMNQ